MTAALFLFMSYFGTDQSQVARYINGRSIAESRLGLIMNGLLKVPMQFVILFIGVMVFVFYQFHEPPVFFNRVQTDNLRQSEYAEQLQALEDGHTAIFTEKEQALRALVLAQQQGDEVAVRQHAARANALLAEDERVREEVKALTLLHDPKAETNDKDYIFMGFVMDHLPMGMIGLLFAVMFSAAMSSTSSELNALASTTTVDLYKRSIRTDADDAHYLRSSKGFTLLWGVLAIVFATTASLFENLIQAVNLLGSLFYGTILGIFLVAFYVKRVQGHAVFIAALLAEACVLLIHYLNAEEIAPEWLTMGYLWYNMVGCGLVVGFGVLVEEGLRRKA
jgi:Na+/proline symporter